MHESSHTVRLAVLITFETTELGDHEVAFEQAVAERLITAVRDCVSHEGFAPEPETALDEDPVWEAYTVGMEAVTTDGTHINWEFELDHHTFGKIVISRGETHA